MNKNSKSTNVETNRFEEILGKFKTARNIFTNEIFELKDGIVVNPLTAAVLEIK